jgi:hypothetical protein
MLAFAFLLAASIAIHSLRKRRGGAACPLAARLGGNGPAPGSKPGCGCGF